MKILRNQKGVSLVGVLMASGLVGGLFLLVGKLMQNSNMVLKTTEVGLEVLDYEALLEDTLRDRASCTRTFGKVLSTDPTPVTIREGFAPSSNNTLDTNGIFNADGTEIWKKDDLVVGGLKLKSLTIPEKRFDPNTKTQVQNYTTINSALNKGFVEVHLELEKTGKSTKTFGGRNKHIKLYLTTEVYDDANGDYRTSSCQLSGAPMQSPGVELAEELACATNNKFYDKSKEPKCQESKGLYNRLPSRGYYNGMVREGNSLNYRCPQGTGLVGLDGYNNGDGDREDDGNAGYILPFELICQSINTKTFLPNGPFFQVGKKDTSYYLRDPRYKFSSKKVLCPAGAFATGYTTRAISYKSTYLSQQIHKVSLICKNMKSGVKSKSSALGKVRTDLETPAMKTLHDKCNKDTVLRGIDISASHRVNSLRGICW